MPEIFTLTNDNLTGTYLLKIEIPGQQIQEIICVDENEVYTYIQDIVIKIEDYLRDVKLSGSKVIDNLNMQPKSSINKKWRSDLYTLYCNETMSVYAKTIVQQNEQNKKYRLYDIDDKVLGEFDNIETAIAFFKTKRPQFDDPHINHFIYEVTE